MAVRVELSLLYILFVWKEFVLFANLFIGYLENFWVECFIGTNEVLLKLGGLFEI